VIPFDLVGVGRWRSARAVRTTRGRRRFGLGSIFVGIIWNEDFEFVAFFCLLSDNERNVDCLRVSCFLG